MPQVPEPVPPVPTRTESPPDSGKGAPEPPQPKAKDGVSESMATLAIHPGMLRDLPSSPAAHHPYGDFPSMEDSAVMLELRSGNMVAFDFLVARYRKPIISFMYRMTHNQAVAEELAQEVFLRVFRSRETYRAEARFSTWLYRIATNLGVNHARDNRRERTAPTTYLDEVDPETGTFADLPDATPSAETRLLRAERLRQIREIVLALPERQRVAVLMHKYDGMDYREIGAVLKLSESATKSLLFRAYQTLREKLKGFI